MPTSRTTRTSEEWARLARMDHIRRMDTPHVAIVVEGGATYLEWILRALDKGWDNGAYGEYVIVQDFAGIAYDTETGTYLDESEA